MLLLLPRACSKASHQPSGNHLEDGVVDGNFDLLLPVEGGPNGSPTGTTRGELSGPQGTEPLPEQLGKRVAEAAEGLEDARHDGVALGRRAAVLGRHGLAAADGFDGGAWGRAGRKKAYRLGDVSLVVVELGRDGCFAKVVGGGLSPYWPCHKKKFFCAASLKHHYNTYYDIPQQDKTIATRYYVNIFVACSKLMILINSEYAFKISALIMQA